MDEHLDRAQAAVLHARRLRADLAALARSSAEAAETSARLHDDAASAHEAMEHPVLAPEALRRHAERDRAFAAAERQEAEELERG